MTTASTVEPRELDYTQQERDDHDDTPAVQLRRRRAASLRLAPLADGRRDPWSTKW